MDSDTTQELGLEQNTFLSHPAYSHRDGGYQAYKVLIKQIAERLVEDDVKKIIHFCDLPSTLNSADSLDILTRLEKKGQFSHANIDPLKGLLQNIDRCDLVNQLVDPFSRMQHMYRRQSTQSLPPGNLSRYSASCETPYPTANGNVERSLPHTKSQRYRTWTPGYLSRQSSRPNLSSVTEDMFLPLPTDVAPLGLPQPRATSLIRTPSHTVLQGYHHREEQECASGSQMSLSLSVQFPSQTYLTGNSSLHETTYMPAQRSELALHHRPSVISMLPPNNSALALCQPAEIPATPFTSCAGKHPSPPISIPGSIPHSHTETLPSLQQVERQHSRERQRKVTIGQQTTVLSRKKMVNYLRDHQYNKYIRVQHRLTLNMGCKNNPQLGFKVWPCGLEGDKDESVTFQADVYFPAKCSTAAVRSQVKLMVTVTDNQTGEKINSCSEEFSLGSLGTTVHNLIQHTALIRSRSLTIRLTVEAEILEFHPQQQSEAEFNMEEVHSPMAEYQQEDGEMFMQIDPNPENRPIPETQ